MNAPYNLLSRFELARILLEKKQSERKVNNPVVVIEMLIEEHGVLFKCVSSYNGVNLRFGYIVPYQNIIQSETNPLEDYIEQRWPNLVAFRGGESPEDQIDQVAFITGDKQ